MRLLMTSLTCVGAAACLVLVGSTLLYRVSMGAAGAHTWSTKAEAARGSALTASVPQFDPTYFGDEYATQHRALVSLPDEPAAPTF